MRFQHSAMENHREKQMLLSFSWVHYHNMNKTMTFEQIEHFVYTNKNNANHKIKKTHAQPYTHSFGASERPVP